MRMMTGLILTTLVLAACQPREVQTARDDYVVYCAGCHGALGQGDGSVAPGLADSPADLTRLAADNGGEFPMLAVMARIDGYNLHGGTMPEFGPLMEGETVLFETDPGIMTPTPARLIALAEYVEHLQE